MTQLNCYVILIIKQLVYVVIQINVVKSKQVHSFTFIFLPHLVPLGDNFCKSSPPAQQQSPLKFNGGLTGVDENYFSYYILSLYWPPSSCPLIYNATNDLLRYFCSPYTNVNQPGSERLVLHGLWPTFSTEGNYQGWPQFCSSGNQDWSNCHIDGNLCPWKNTTQNDFSQGNYELCLATENIEQCLVNSTQILEPEKERLKILAPGYLNQLNLFINHEWTKHGREIFSFEIKLVFFLNLRIMLFIIIWK
jgi:ribonuclease I